MTEPTGHTLAFRYTSQTRYSIATLLGALETDPRLAILRTCLLSSSEVPTDTIAGLIKTGHVTVAYSVMSTQMQRVIHETKIIRSLFNRRVTLIAGGPHASARPYDLLNAGFDYVVVGEGEYALPEFMTRLMNGEDVDSIQGVVSHRSDRYPTPKNIPHVNLDDYPPFALGMNVLGPVEVTRGCPFQCKFCATPFLTGGRVRHRSVQNVAYWLQQAVKRRGFRRSWFLSPNALCYGGHGRTVELERLEELLRTAVSVESLEGVFFGTFPSEVRPDFVSKRALELMRHYVANKTIQIGLQSGSDRVLELINRHHTVEEGLDAVRTALDCGFIPHVDMIFGLPGEETADSRKSLDICQLLIDMGAKIHGHVFMPLPGSAFENMPPGEIDAETRAMLGELSRRGLLTGAWCNQERLGENLSKQREEYTTKHS